MPIKQKMLDYLDNPETEKKFKRFLRKEQREKNIVVLSEEEKKEIKKLERKALELWKKVVKKRAGYKCEVPSCHKTKFLNAHHIESYTTNKSLRYDPENGLCVDPTHHKFGWLSAHRSFCFLYELMLDSRFLSLRYLQEHYRIRVLVTKEFLGERIKTLTSELGEKEGK